MAVRTAAVPPPGGATGVLRNRWFILLFSVISMVAVANLQYGWTLFVPPLSKQLGQDQTLIQVAFTVFVLLETWLVPFEGWLVDRFGPRTVGIPTAAFQLAGSILAARAHTSETVAIAGFLLGVAWGAMVPIGVALLFERSSRTKRGAAMGAYNMALSLGTLGGSALATLSSAIGFGYAPAVIIAGAGPALALPWVFALGPGKVRT